MLGVNISHYEVLSELGRGGMGVVYLARDVTLGRRVALKVLSPTMVHDEQAHRRFLREARAVAALSHRNIAAIYDAGVHDGQPYLVFELIQGVELGDHVTNKNSSLGERLELCAQVADGLAHAHTHGVVHRDIKPGNILVSDDGVVRILDFGLAKPDTGREETRTGVTVGTAAYMSPEQVRGDRTDYRTDLWSLGVVLVELTTGRRPFDGPYEVAVSYSILNADPDFAGWRPLPPALQDLIRSLLAKEVETRPESAGQVARELRAIATGPNVIHAPSDETVPPVINTRHARRTSAGRGRLARRIWIMRWTIGVLLTLSIILVMKFGLPWSPKSASGGEMGVAVLPFEDLSPGGEHAYIGEGMSEDLAGALTQVEGVRIPGRASLAYVRDQHLEVRDIGKRLRVNWVVQGTVRVVERRLRVNVELSDVRTGFQVWNNAYDEGLEDLLGVQDRIVREIIRKISGTIGLEMPDDVALRGASRNPEAHDAYLRGVYYRTRLDGERALEYLDRALALDSTFALAHAWKAITLAQLVDFGLMAPNEALPVIDHHAAESLRLSPDLAIGEAALSRAYALRLQFEVALAHANRSAELNPSGTDVTWSSRVAALVALGRLVQARDAVREEYRRDPISVATGQYTALILTNLGSEGDARTVIDTTLALYPANAFLTLRQADLVARDGDPLRAAGMIRAFDAAGPVFSQYRGYYYALAGARDSLLTVLSALERQSADGYVSPFALATLEAYMGDVERAFELYGTAIEDGDAWLSYAGFVVPPASVRDDPRYHDFLDRIVPDNPWKRARYDAFGRLTNPADVER